MEEVEEVEDVADENCEDLYKGFAKKVAKMPFDQSKSNTSSSKTLETKTARSAPSRMDLVLDPTNVKETNSAPTTGRVVLTDMTRLSGGSSIHPKINVVPAGSQFLMKPMNAQATSASQIQKIQIGQVKNGNA